MRVYLSTPNTALDFVMKNIKETTSESMRFACFKMSWQPSFRRCNGRYPSPWIATASQYNWEENTSADMGLRSFRTWLPRSFQCDGMLGAGYAILNRRWSGNDLTHTPSSARPWHGKAALQMMEPTLHKREEQLSKRGISRCPGEY